MEVTFQHHAPAVLSPQKTKYPLNRRLSALQSPSGHLEKRKICCSCRDSNPLCPSRGPVTIRSTPSRLHDKILKLPKRYLNIWSAYLQFEPNYVKSAGTMRFSILARSVLMRSHWTSHVRERSESSQPERMQLTANKSSFRHSSLTVLHLDSKLFISSSDSQTQVLIRCQKENNTLHLYGNTCHVLGDRCMNENNFLCTKVQSVQMTLCVPRLYCLCQNKTGTSRT